MELEARSNKIGPSDYSVDQYMNDQEMLVAITRNDPVLQGEVVRLFQNSCRNDAVRDKILTWPDFFVCVK